MTASLDADQFDQACITYARDLIACQNTADITALYTARYGPDSPEVRNAAARGAQHAYAAAFGRAQAVLADLLAIIDRQARELGQLRPTVPMACNECGGRVHREQTVGRWAHSDGTPDHGSYITAGIAYGHPLAADAT